MYIIHIYLNRGNATSYALAKASPSTSLLHFMKATTFYSQEECINFHFYFDKNKKLGKIFVVDIFLNSSLHLLPTLTINIFIYTFFFILLIWPFLTIQSLDGRVMYSEVDLSPSFLLFVFNQPFFTNVHNIGRITFIHLN